MHSCVLRSYCSSSAIRCAIQKRVKLLYIVYELAGTYREPSQHFRGLYLQLADTISSQLHTVADVWRHLIQRYVTAVPRPTTLQITLWIKRKSLFWTSSFKTRNSQRTGNWRLQYSHQVAWQIHSPWSLTWPMFSWSLEISMRYSSVLMTICWIIWKTDMWPLMTVVKTRTFPSTQWWPLRYFARICSGIFPRIPEQRVDRTMRQSDSLTAVCIDSYFKVDTWIVPGCDDGRQQVGMPSF